MPKFVIKEIDKKKSIGQVAKELGVQTHVIRFWETKFEQIKPMIGKGDRRYYFKKDVETLKKIKYFLYEEGYTISGLQKLLSSRAKSKKREEGLQEETNDHVVQNQSNITLEQKHQIDKIVQNIEFKIQQFQNLIR